jgi:SAM-dependent methyltransferase
MLFNTEHRIIQQKRLKDHTPFLWEQAAMGLRERMALIHHPYQSICLSGVGQDILKRMLDRPLHDLGTYDLILDMFTMQDENDVPAFLKNAYHALTQDGVFLCVFMGGDSLQEIYHVLAKAETTLYNRLSPRVYPMIDIKTAGTLLSKAGFILPVTDKDILTLEYQTFWHFLKDWRNMGFRNSLCARQKGLTHPRLFQQAAELFKGTVTIELVYGMGWRG